MLRLLLPVSALLVVFLLLLALIAIFADHNVDKFLALQNAKTILKQTVIVGIGALAMTMIIVSGGIDLSAGSVVALSAVGCALVVRAGGDTVSGLTIAMAVCAAVLIGAAVGFCNGTISARLDVAPFIVTLGTMMIARGMAEGFASESVVRTAESGLKDLMMRQPDPAWLIVAPGVWVMLFLLVAIVVLMRFTVFGRYIYALGANEQASRFSGIKVEQNRVAIFTLAGALFGLAGVMSYAEIGDGDPTTAVALELDIIAAVVIGGASLSGGRGTPGGSMLGALIITLLYNGCAMLGVADWVQKVLIGSIIVAAVWIDGVRAKRAV